MTMAPSIRPAISADYESVCVILAEADAIHHASEPDFFRLSTESCRPLALFEQWLAADDFAVYVAEAFGQAVGVLLLSERAVPDGPLMKPRRYANIDMLAVLEDWRSQGLGHALLQQAEGWARGRGLDSVELSVWEFNQRALALYKGTGYRTLRRYMGKQLT
jgi:ribosomal protein S18 acetylase RimI-like enzyme